MKITFRHIQTVLITASVILLAGLIAYYFLIIQPLEQGIEEKETELGYEREVLETLKQSDGPEKQYTDLKIQSLLQQVPVKPWIDHWLMDFEKAELMSDTQINHYVFSKDVLSASAIHELEEVEEPAIETEVEFNITNETGNQENAGVTGEFEEDTDVDVRVDVKVHMEDEKDPPSPATGDTSVESAMEMADGVKVNRMTSGLSVEAETFEQLFQFLYEIEQLPRLTEIYALSFNAPSERDLLFGEEDDETDLLNMDVYLSAYYVKELEHVFADYKPSGPFEDPGFKVTPIYQDP
ncbi:hypothetical protein [Salipaludibacillus aurantiacus]|uniref:Type IV pilus assembly protein PilO n=1 Tax=Salipaludibacillus aurantiacus TaxID=1601833 RepID=A0A1H9T585_9BACI|nr:hypothetical protein [Salipaludibacillus aurantiacus]SER92382.1 hypothetical protein SAMN05518684_105130 [Salipaludibacillus aurantiacus]